MLDCTYGRHQLPDPRGTSARPSAAPWSRARARLDQPSARGARPARYADAFCARLSRQNAGSVSRGLPVLRRGNSHQAYRRGLDDNRQARHAPVAPLLSRDGQRRALLAYVAQDRSPSVSAPALFDGWADGTRRADRDRRDAWASGPRRQTDFIGALSLPREASPALRKSRGRRDAGADDARPRQHLLGPLRRQSDGPFVS